METEEDNSTHTGEEEYFGNSVLRECIGNIINAANSSRKAEKGCRLCDSENKIKTRCDLFEVYGKLLSCVTFHLSTISSVPFVDLFILDNFVLGLIMDKKDYSIENTLCETKDLERRVLLSNHLVSKAKTFFSEENIKIYCEQELESLFYKFYRKAEDLFRNHEECNLLLWILFKRRESDRFFRIYKVMEKKSVLTYKLALLFTLEEDCLKSSDQLLEEIERKFSPEDLSRSNLPKCCGTYHEQREYVGRAHPMVFSEESSEEASRFRETNIGRTCRAENIFSVCSHKSSEPQERCKTCLKFYNEITTVLYGSISDFEQLKEWYTKKKSQMGWNSCLEMWSKNRADGTGLVDEAMIAICAEHKEFEQGWMIYKSSAKQEGCVSKAALLSLRALKHNGGTRWITRVSEVVQLAATKNMKHVCCEITSNAVQIISNISEERRKTILKCLIDNIRTMAHDEEVMCCLLKAFLTLCTKCKSAGTCEMCVQYANQFYDEWKAHKERTKSFFFGSKSIWEKKIYCNMLGVCTETENCKGFYSVCCDLVRNGMDVDCETLSRLEKYHMEKHKNCTCVETKLDRKKLGMGLLKHLLRDMK